MATVSTKAVIEDGFSPTIKKWNDELGHVAQAVNGLNRSVDDQAKIIDSQAAAIAKTSARLRELNAAEEEAKRTKAASRDETQKLSDALADSIIRLKAQKELLQDPVFSQNLKYQQSLRSEIDQMTKAVTGAEIAQKAENEAVKLTVRSRRELIVLAHELSQGQYKNFGGSLMVLEEGEGGIIGAVKAATAMLGGPYVVAAGAAALATAGIGAAFWKASEHAAEHYHKMSQMAQTYGTTAQTMMGFEQLSIGTGISVAQLGESFSRFTTNLSAHRQELERVGITARDPVQAFEQLMDIAQRTQDPIARSAILTQALGEEWRKLAPLLMKGGDAARDAIKEMAIPEDVQENYKRASEAQIEIDKNLTLIGQHAGESLSGIRAWFKEWESGFARMAAHEGIIAALGSLTSRGRLFNAAEQLKEQGSKNPTGFYAGFSASAALTKEQQAALDDTAKRVSKESLDSELAQVRKEFEEKASLFERSSAEYRTIMERELIAEGEVRKKWAKKGAGPRGPSESQIETNVIRTGPNEVTMRGAMSWNADRTGIEGGNEDERAKGIERLETGRKKAEQKQVADAKKLHEEVQRISEKNLADNLKLEANAQKIRMNWEAALIEKKRQAHDEEMKLIRERFDVGQKLASDQVYKMLQGEFTIQGAVNATKDVMFRAFADTTTKWIEEQLIKMVFAKGAQAEETATAVAQASAVGAAWAAPSMATSIATFGGSTATGSAAWFTAMTAAQGYSVMPHARGGAVFGPVNASREEAFAPFVPGRIIPSYNSTTNHNTTNAQSITIHVHGGDEKTILRTLRKAGINGAGVSRS